MSHAGPQDRERIIGLTLSTWILAVPELKEKWYLEGGKNRGEIPGAQAQVGKDMVEVTRCSENWLPLVSVAGVMAAAVEAVRAGKAVHPTLLYSSP